MRRSRFSEEEIVQALRRSEAGTRTSDLCRSLGVSEQTFYRWKSKYGALGGGEARRLKQLELDNARLQRLLSQRELELEGMRMLLTKKW